VRDTGIAPVHRRVFEPLYQVDSSMARAAQGMGLRLAVVAAFVRSHHGRLAVRSGDGMGTAVHLAPLKLAPDDTKQPVSAGADGPVGAKH
jgi:two-component system OmpR family sensor kinase